VGRLFAVSNFSYLSLSALLPAKDEPIKPLGRGAFGDVWLCEHKTKHVQVAVKKLLKIDGDTDRQQLLERWRKEVQSMISLSSLHVVSLYDSFEDEFTCDLVMEFCSRGNLRAYLSSLQTSGKCMTESVYLFCSSFSAVFLSCF
jgi:serine/threonine protein kinase